MLEQIYTSAKTIDYATSYYVQCLVYLRAWDAMLYHRGNGQINKVFRDGTRATLSTYVTHRRFWSREGGRALAFFGNVPSNPELFAVDEITGLPDLSQSLGHFSPPDNFGAAFLQMAMLDDRQGYICYSVSSPSRLIIRTWPDLALAAAIAAPGTFNTFHWMGPGRCLALNHSAGKVMAFDYLEPQILWESVVQPFHLGCWDCEHGLLITCQADGQVRVYWPEPVPVNLSAPAFYPAATPTRLKSYPMRARLTGSVGEPCPGWVVNWQVAAPALGSLEAAQSLTDADGYAYNRYLAPAAATGQDTVLALVRTP
jgi:hypothetical protein